MGLLIDLDNLEDWTKEFARAYKPCFYEPYSMKYLTKFANDRFENIVNRQELDFSKKEYKKYNEIFVKSFIDEIVRLIELDPKKPKDKK